MFLLAKGTLQIMASTLKYPFNRQS